ncbi:MAG: magnesium transporter [Deltaproteobacteria bacterium]|nr:magnesium transporter [Deltaproteobacteria bacterium]
MSKKHAPWKLLKKAIASQDANRVEECIDSFSATERARAISRLTDEERALLVTILSPSAAAEIVEELSESQAAEIMEDIAPSHAAEILSELPSAEQADIVGELEEKEASAILSEMLPSEAEEVRELKQYPSDTAGGLMITEYLSYPSTFTVDDVIRDLRDHSETYTHFDVKYIYVTANHHTLIGVLPLRDLLLSPKEARLSNILSEKPVFVRTKTPLEDLKKFLDASAYTGLPVVDKYGELVGVVKRADVEEALGERAEETLMKISGIAFGEELRSLPLRDRTVRRFSWLSVNIFLNLISASVIALYQNTLSEAVVLAVFLPIISDMSGCSGNQAIAVTLRELTLGIVKPYEFAWVLSKEALLGTINGLLLGAILGAVTFIWKGNIYLSLVVALALALNNLIAVSIGGTIPLFLKLFKKDPALASGPILTTITDMCGFFLVLSFATLVLSKIAG